MKKKLEKIDEEFEKRLFNLVHKRALRMIKY